MRTPDRSLLSRRHQRLLDAANGVAFQIRAYGGVVEFAGFDVVDDQHIVYLFATWTTLAGQFMEADLEVGLDMIGYSVLGEVDAEGWTPIHDHAFDDFSVAMLPGLTVMPYRAPAPAA